MFWVSLCAGRRLVPTGPGLAGRQMAAKPGSGCASAPRGSPAPRPGLEEASSSISFQTDFPFGAKDFFPGCAMPWLLSQQERGSTLANSSWVWAAPRPQPSQSRHRDLARAPWGTVTVQTSLSLSHPGVSCLPGRISNSHCIEQWLLIPPKRESWGPGRGGKAPLPPALSGKIKKKQNARL